MNNNYIYLRFFVVACVIVFARPSGAITVCENTLYRNYSSVISRLISLGNASNGFASVIDLGVTSKMNSIKAIKITSPNGANQGSRPIVLVTGAIHGREWMGAEVAVGLAEYLLENMGKTDSLIGTKGNVKDLLETLEVWIVPVLNPDGYDYSGAGKTKPEYSLIDSTYTDSAPGMAYTPGECDSIPDRSNQIPANTCPSYRDWRKNRKDYTNEVGSPPPSITGIPDEKRVFVGVELNRNFEYSFQSADAIKNIDPTDPDPDIFMSYSSYPGQSAFSEKETQAIRDFFSQHSGRIVAELDYHTPGDATSGGKVLTPFSSGDTIGKTPYLRPNSKTTDDKIFPMIAGKMAAAISPQYSPGAKYGGSSIFHGVARDWIFGNQHVAAFNIEINKAKDYRQLQDSYQEIPTYCKQDMNGALWLMLWAADKGLDAKPGFADAP